MIDATRRDALKFAAAGLTALLGADAAPGETLFRRPGVAFGTTVAVSVYARDAGAAEPAFAAAFAEIRRLDRLSSLTRPESELYRLNRDGRLDDPSPDLLEMLRVASLMHEATAGAFDVTIQPLWLALDRAAKQGRWPEGAELAEIRALVDQRALRVEPGRVVLERPGMGVTLNSLSRGLAADRVAQALQRHGVARAMFDTDVLGGRGSAEGRPWIARVRHPRRAETSVALTPIDAFLATSGDYQYVWSPDYARHHIVDPRRGESPPDFAGVTVKAGSGLIADALSTAALLAGRDAAPALLARFQAEGLFVDKAGAVSRTPGFAVLSG